jgi:hypothetical protein
MLPLALAALAARVLSRVFSAVNVVVDVDILVIVDIDTAAVPV